MNMSAAPASRSASSWGIRSSPSIAATRSVTPAASAASRNAWAQATGFSAPALVITLMPRDRISASRGAITRTASGTKPASGSRCRARASSAIVISER